jgi:hypothetical protein
MQLPIFLSDGREKSGETEEPYIRVSVSECAYLCVCFDSLPWNSVVPF